MKDFEKILDEALQLIIENEKFEEPKAVKFSKEHEEKMRKIFEEEREKENKKRIKTFVKIASLAACVVLLFFVINSFYVKENSLNKPQPIVGEDTRNNILSGCLCLSSVITITFSSVRIFPAPELRRSIFLGIHSLREDAELQPEDLRFDLYLSLA